MKENCFTFSKVFSPKDDLPCTSICFSSHLFFLFKIIKSAFSSLFFKGQGNFFLHFGYTNYEQFFIFEMHSSAFGTGLEIFNSNQILLWFNGLNNNIWVGWIVFKVPKFAYFWIFFFIYCYWIMINFFGGPFIFNVITGTIFSFVSFTKSTVPSSMLSQKLFSVVAPCTSS